MVFLGGWEVFDPRVDGQRLSVTSPEWHRWFVAELRRRIEAMQAVMPRPVPIALVDLPCPTTDTMRVGLGAWERAVPARVCRSGDTSSATFTRPTPGDAPRRRRAT